MSEEKEAPAAVPAQKTKYVINRKVSFCLPKGAKQANRGGSFTKITPVIGAFDADDLVKRFGATQEGAEATIKNMLAEGILNPIQVTGTGVQIPVAVIPEGGDEDPSPAIWTVPTEKLTNRTITQLNNMIQKMAKKAGIDAPADFQDIPQAITFLGKDITG